MLTVQTKLNEKIQVAIQDFPQRLNWEAAKIACNELGSGWRLPTIQELIVIRKELNEKDLNEFNISYYWSNTEVDAKYAWYLYFDKEFVVNYYMDKQTLAYVRAVRNFDNLLI